MSGDKVQAVSGIKGYTLEGWGGNVVSFVDYVTRNCNSNFQFGRGSHEVSLRGCDVICLADRR